MSRAKLCRSRAQDLWFEVVLLITIAILFHRAVNNFTTFNFSGLPPNFKTNSQCHCPSDPSICNPNKPFKKFIWFATDGYSYKHAAEWIDRYRQNAMVFTVYVPKPRWSHWIYTSWFTGLPPNNWFANVIQGDTIFHSLYRSTKGCPAPSFKTYTKGPGVKIRYIGPKWSCLGLLGGSRATTHYFSTVELVNEFGNDLPDYSTINSPEKMTAKLQSAYKSNESIFLHSSIMDKYAHNSPERMNESAAILTPMFGGTILKDFIDEHPEYVLIISSDHGGTTLDSPFHGRSHTFPELDIGFFMMYNPAIFNSKGQEIDVVDVAPLLSSLLVDMDIPLHSVGVIPDYYGASICHNLSLTLGGRCLATSDGFTLSNPDGLFYKELSFDDNLQEAGEAQPINICMLALYGTNPSSIPAVPNRESYGLNQDDAPGVKHWYGNCFANYCDKCVNDRIFSEGYNWDNFTIGGRCDGSNAKNKDRALTKLFCKFDEVIENQEASEKYRLALVENIHQLKQASEYSYSGFKIDQEEFYTVARSDNLAVVKEYANKLKKSLSVPPHPNHYLMFSCIYSLGFLCFAFFAWFFEALPLKRSMPGRRSNGSPIKFVSLVIPVAFIYSIYYWFYLPYFGWNSWKERHSTSTAYWKTKWPYDVLHFTYFVGAFLFGVRNSSQMKALLKLEALYVIGCLFGDRLLSGFGDYSNSAVLILSLFTQWKLKSPVEHKRVHRGRQTLSLRSVGSRLRDTSDIAALVAHIFIRIYYYTATSPTWFNSWDLHWAAAVVWSTCFYLLLVAVRNGNTVDLERSVIIFLLLIRPNGWQIIFVYYMYKVLIGQLLFFETIPKQDDKKGTSMACLGRFYYKWREFLSYRNVFISERVSCITMLLFLTMMPFFIHTQLIRNTIDYEVSTDPGKVGIVGWGAYPIFAGVLMATHKFGLMIFSFFLTAFTVGTSDKRWFLAIKSDMITKLLGYRAKFGLVVTPARVLIVTVFSNLLLFLYYEHHMLRTWKKGVNIHECFVQVCMDGLMLVIVTMYSLSNSVKYSKHKQARSHVLSEFNENGLVS